MNRVVWKAVGLTITLLTCVGVNVSASPAAPETSNSVDDMQLVFVTEDHHFGIRGCDSITVFDYSSLGPIFRGAVRVSPGRLAATTGLTLVLAVNSNILGSNSFLHVLRRSRADVLRWDSDPPLVGANFHIGGGIAIGADDNTLLVTTTPHFPNYIARPGPASISKFLLSEVKGNQIGPVRGTYVLDAPAAEIVVDAVGSWAHVLTVAGGVRTIDSQRMVEVAPPIDGVAPVVSGFASGRAPATFFHATLTPDGRVMVANRWQGRGVTVFDLNRRSATAVDVSASIVGGVAFNHADANHGLLAVHEDTRIAVYRYIPPATLELVGAVTIARPNISGRGASAVQGPFESIAWSGDGTRLVAATDVGSAEFQVLKVVDEGRTLVPERLLTACPEPDGPANWPNDILTSNRLRPSTPPHRQRLAPPPRPHRRPPPPPPRPRPTCPPQCLP